MIKSTNTFQNGKIKVRLNKYYVYIYGPNNTHTLGFSTVINIFLYFSDVEDFPQLNNFSSDTPKQNIL